MANIDGIGSIGLAALFHSIGAADGEIDACVAILKRDYPDPGTYEMIMREARAALDRARRDQNTVDADPEPAPVPDGEAAPVAGVISPTVVQAASE